MNPNPRPRLRAAVDAKCKECVYDPLSRGTWREQVADCGGVSCPLYEIRPVPSHCIRNGVMVPAEIAAIRAKIKKG